MTRVGANKMRAQRAASKRWRDIIAYWMLRGQDLNALIVPADLPSYLVNRIVEEERERRRGDVESS